MKVIKKSIPAKVAFACAPGTLDTLEGPVHYEAGDALMTGVAGERWPIPRATFDTTYSAVPPVQHGEDGNYLKKPMIADAERSVQEAIISIDNGKGMLHAKAGDWILSTPDGKQWVVAADVFDATYVEIFAP